MAGEFLHGGLDRTLAEAVSWEVKPQLCGRPQDVGNARALVYQPVSPSGMSLRDRKGWGQGLDLAGRGTETCTPSCTGIEQENLVFAPFSLVLLLVQCFLTVPLSLPLNL